MYPITMLIKCADGSHRIHNGILIPSPPELRDKIRINQYLKIDRAGWGTDDLGFQYFASWLPNGDLLIFPALEIVGEKRGRRKFYGYNHLFTRSQIETLSASYSEEIGRQEQNSLEKSNLLIHDLRALSNIIYNAAVEAQNFINFDKKSDALTRIDNIIAS